MGCFSRTSRQTQNHGPRQPYLQQSSLRWHHSDSSDELCADRDLKVYKACHQAGNQITIHLFSSHASNETLLTIFLCAESSGNSQNQNRYVLTVWDDLVGTCAKFGSYIVDGKCRVSKTNDDLGIMNRVSTLGVEETGTVSQVWWSWGVLWRGNILSHGLPILARRRKDRKSSVKSPCIWRKHLYSGCCTRVPDAISARGHKDLRHPMKLQSN